MATSKESIDNLTVSVTKTEDAGGGQVFVTFIVNFNGNEKKFLKMVNNYTGCMPLVLLTDEKVKTFLEFEN